MVDLFVGILLFVAIVIGWLLGKTERKKSVAVEAAGGVGKEYYDGLNLLLNEKQDEAVDLLLKTLDVNGDTFETHIVMGSLYRRRGEVDRSIRIHQDLLARSDLTKAQHAAVKQPRCILGGLAVSQFRRRRFASRLSRRATRPRVRVLPNTQRPQLRSSSVRTQTLNR